MRFMYSQEHLSYLRDHYPVMGLSALTARFNRKFGLNKSEQEIRATTKNHKIKCGRKQGTFREKPKLFSDEIISFARNVYDDISRSELTQKINDKFKTAYTVNQVVAMCKRERLSSGRTGHFSVGHKTWNSGTKGVVKPNSGTIQKGAIPPNLRDFGSERICKKDGYILVKIDVKNPHTGFKGRFVHKHRYIWEINNGPIPEGMVVSFKDGNKLNCFIGNLELLNRETLAVMNKAQVSKAPEELRPTLRTLSKLKAATGIAQRSL